MTLFKSFFKYGLLLCLSGLISEAYYAQSKPTKSNPHITKVVRASTAPVIDGEANDAAWQNATEYQLDQRWLGEPYTPQDFKGTFKLTWTSRGLYLLATITDDVLLDTHKDPLELYWDDDCLEIFVDEDNSGGNHQYNHNAFAYHIALDGNIADMDTDQQAHLFNDDLKSVRITTGNTSIWEVFIPLFKDDFDITKENKQTTLQKGQYIGFALAYCDNDYSAERENFIGSVPVEGEDKNRGWIDASIFGTLLLVE
ncbi:sugar-binding protein [Gangjinia marincola]|uniref:Sugar-binding protein n=1 Tax=Gangjinia marincola TaxID=578463 RepID=A0ABN1MD84_9FLAO